MFETKMVTLNINKINLHNDDSWKTNHIDRFLRDKNVFSTLCYKKFRDKTISLLGLK